MSEAIPRNGMWGTWDRLVGPGMPASETALVAASSLCGAFLAALRLNDLRMSPLQIVIGSAIAFDTIGGAVCNSTITTRRWYHRPGTRWTSHLAFVLPHLIYVGLVAWLFRKMPFDLFYAEVVSALLLLSTLAVLASPRALKQPVAFGLYIAVIALTSIYLGPTSGLEWFIAALFLKLLVGHLVPNERG